MKTQNSSLTKTEALKWWAGVAFVIWIAFGASFGAAGDFLADPTPNSTDMRVLFVYVPLLSLGWPLYLWAAIKLKLL